MYACPQPDQHPPLRRGTPYRCLEITRSAWTRSCDSRFATIYDNQNDEDETEHISPLVSNNNSEMCKYHVLHNLSNDLITNVILSGNTCTYLYLHLNCRRLSSNWEKFQDVLFDMNSDIFVFDYIGFSEVFRCDLDQRIRSSNYHNDEYRGYVALSIKDTLS